MSEPTCARCGRPEDVCTGHYVDEPGSWGDFMRLAGYPGLVWSTLFNDE